MWRAWSGCCCLLARVLLAAGLGGFEVAACSWLHAPVESNKQNDEHMDMPHSRRRALCRRQRVRRGGGGVMEKHSDAASHARVCTTLQRPPVC